MNIDDLDLPKDLEDEKVSADIDDLDLPKDLEDEKVSADIDDLDLPKDLEDEKVSADIDDLDLPEDLEDEKVSADIDDLGLPEDLGLDEDLVENQPSDLDDLGLPEDKELEDKIAKDINDADSNSNKNIINSDKLPVLDDLPLPDSLPNIDSENEANDYIDNVSDDLNDILDDNEKVSDNNLDNTLLEDDLDLEDLDNLSLDTEDEAKPEPSDKSDSKPLEDDLDLEDLDSLSLDTEDEAKPEPSDKSDSKPLEDDLDNLSLDAEEEPQAKTSNKSDTEPEEDDLDSLSLDTEDEAKPELSDKLDSKPSEDDLDLEDLDSLSLDTEDEAKPEPSDKSDSKPSEDDLDLEDLDSLSLDTEDEAKPEPSDKSDSKPSEDDLDLEDLDSLSLDTEDEAKPELSDKSDSKPSEDDLDLEDLDSLSLDTEDEAKPETSDKSDSKPSEDDLDLDNLSLDDALEHHNIDEHDDLDLDDAINDNNIIEGGTSLPSPDSADNLAASKYDDVDKDIDHDKVINAIKYLAPLTQYHVLDAILNEKLDKDSMETLLNALERGESNDVITEILNNELGLKIKEEGRKNVLDLIPIPNSLKDYARIIRVAAVFLILFVALVILSFQFIYKPVMANKYYNQGLVNISNGAYDEAERNFAEGERLRPKQIKWYNKYARAYIARETFNDALNKIQGALDIKPRDFETRITFGYYYRKKGEKELSEEDYILGEQLYNDMLVYTEKKKEKETIYDERGLLMISRAKNMLEPEYYNIAYTNYSDMVNFFGDGVVPRKRAMLIKIYQDNYKHVKALQDHIELLEPGYIDDEVYPTLAKYLLDKEDFYGSRILFEKLLTAYPNNLESIVGYADYETRLKHYDRAMEILNTAALPLYEADPFYRGKEYVYNMLGQIYYNLGEYGNAVKNFNEALSINEVYPDANYNLGNVYFYKDKDYVKAKQYYQMAYDNLAPNLRSDQLLYNLSWIYYLDEEYDSAFEGFNALFQKNPSNSVVSYALANSLLHLDKANLANGFYRNALSQVLAKRNSLGRLEMRTERDFILVSYLASLYNNIGVAYAYTSTVTNTIANEQEAFKHFVLASEYFDQVRTSNIDLERAEKRTILIDDQNIGAATYNIMSMQAKRNLKEATVIDNYIPKDMYYLR